MKKLYSDDHIEKEQHRLYTIEDYSRGSLFLIDPISDFIIDNQFSEVLEYGCGLARLSQALSFDFDVQYYPYDPAIPEFTERPSPKQMTMAVSALEYCEETYIDEIINDLSELTLKSTFIAINTRLLGGIPPKILKNNSWWVSKLSAKFDIAYFRLVGDGFICLAEPVKKETSLDTEATLSPKMAVS